MEKTVYLGSTPTTLSNSLKWALIYRDQFGKDVVSTIVPAIIGAVDIIAGLLTESGVTLDKDNRVNLDVTKIADVIGTDAYYDAIAQIMGLELTDLINVTWAMAKAYDRSIPDPMRWAETVEAFPLDEVAPVVLDLAMSGFISSKKAEKIREMMANLKRLTPTPSSSPGSNED